MQHKEKVYSGIRYQHIRVPQNSDKTTDSLCLYEGNDLKNMITSLDDRNTKSYIHYVNGYASYYFKKGTYLKLDADYMNTKSNTGQDYSAMSSGTISTKSWARNSLYAGRLAFVAPLMGGTVKTGFDFSYTINKNSYKVLDTSTMQNELQTTQNTARQNGQSIFLQYERNWGEHWSGYAGLYFENITFKYYMNGERSDASRNYRDLYPSTSISYHVNDIQLTLAYRATTRRPSYFMLRSAIE